MANSRVVLKADNVKKGFFLPHSQSNSIKESIVQVLKPKKKGGETYHALNGLSFEVREGDFFGVVGRNGAGKSTLLRILAEIYQPTTGKVWHHGKLVPFIELGVGFNDNLTARQNVYLNGAMLGFSKKEMDDRYDSIVEFAELEKFMDQKLKNFSSGMRVRLAFSVAIQADADILLLDEVLAVGDTAFKRKCFDYFDTLKSDHTKTVIYVSHSMNTIRDYCNRAILIEDGKITCAGSSDEVAERYTELFEDKSPVYQPIPTSRAGTKKAFFDDFVIDAAHKKITIKTTVASGSETLPPVHLSLFFKDHKGVMIAGTNNALISKPIELTLKPNEKKAIEIELENIFTDHEYTISASLRSKDEMYDEWKEITNFSNPSVEDVPYPIIVPGKISEA